MSQRIKNILKGVGSVLDIAPQTNYNKYVPKRNYKKRMERHWIRVGENIQRAINRFEYEQKNEKKSAAGPTRYPGPN